MNFPMFPAKHGLPAVVTPDDILDYRRRLGRLPAVEPPEAVLFCLQRGLPERLRRRIRLRRAGRLMGDLYLVRKTGGRVAVLTNIGIGAPALVALAEELIAFGAKRLISIVWGGGLQPDLMPGDVVVCERAIRDEGVSHHYLPSQKFIEASVTLVERLARALEERGQPFQVGATWTTDAPYRETLQEVEQYRAEGIRTVEMEIAGLLAVAQARGVEAASVVVVGDSLAGAKWQPAEQVGPVERSLEVVYAAAIDALVQR